MFKLVNEDMPFEVTIEGIVRSRKTGNILKHRISWDGYPKVNTKYKSKSFNQSVHRLVAIAYIPNPNSYPQVNHIDGDKNNPYVTNLEWCNNSQNQLHAIKTGLRKVQRGSDTHMAKLTDEDVHSICKLIEEGYRNKDIESLTAANRFQVKDIRGKKSWTHISKDYKLIAKRRGQLSVNTVLWICRELEKGTSMVRIRDLTENPLVTKSALSHIKYRNAYIDISKHFKF